MKTFVVVSAVQCLSLKCLLEMILAFPCECFEDDFSVQLSSLMLRTRLSDSKELIGQYYQWNILMYHQSGFVIDPNKFILIVEIVG